jgi:type III restriction enzyme
LIFCIEYENPKSESLKGVFESIRKNFHNLKDSNFLRLLKKAYDFRNTYVAHQDKELNNIEVTRGALKEWIALIVLLEETCRAKVD